MKVNSLVPIKICNFAKLKGIHKTNQHQRERKMMRKVIVFILLSVALCVSAKVDEQQLLERMDQAIANKEHYQRQKENHLKKLKRNLNDALNDPSRLVWLDSIYQAYSTYRYDSATAYIERGMKLAEHSHNEIYIIKNKINRASVLSVGGFYSQSEALLQTINPETLNLPMRKYYYFTKAWLYNYWLDFAANSEFASEYAELKKKYIWLTMQTFTPAERNTAEYIYLKAERLYLSSPTHPAVLAYYLKAAKLTPANTRLHAQSAYGAARYFQDIERYDLYESYLVEAATSDLTCQLKETLALQKLATYIYNKDKKYNKRAAKYITESMEEAQFFNNRLRMLEISNILPVIVSANQQAAERSRTHIQTALVVICLILCVVMTLAIVSMQRKNQLKKTRKEITSKNLELQKLNLRLMETNKRRETYMRLFLNISAVYIRKMDDYRKFVNRKVKAKQVDDLLKATNSYKLAEDEATTFYTSFDQAFMELYPDFVMELNKLLLPEAQITLPADNSLTTEARIFALMRLGVTDSQEIATLLFYSVQTIYNYKSGMRAKAINRETFEADINRLCHII